VGNFVVNDALALEMCALLKRTALQEQTKIVCREVKIYSDASKFCLKIWEKN
jgi:hypothetical protein